jgi:hypothetical protein
VSKKIWSNWLSNSPDKLSQYHFWRGKYFSVSLLDPGGVNAMIVVNTFSKNGKTTQKLKKL